MREEGRRLHLLHQAPVVVVLDGETYVGTGTWPDDTDAEITPAVPLAFTPPLPVYDGR